MRSVYLAGPISGCSYKGCTEWRTEAIETLAQWGILGRSSMRAKEYLQNEVDLKAADYEQPLSTNKAIVTLDRFDVMDSDMVLLYLKGATKVSIGTCIEIGWADAFRKPTVLVIEPEGNPHDHGMVKECCGYRVDNLVSGLKICRAVLA